jgi:AAA domain
MREEFPPVEHIIPDLIMEGLNLLCGGPKLGKSLLMLNCAVAVAQNGVALGSIQVEKPGAVLYLSLEDHKRRLKRRFATLLKDVEASENLEYQTRWKRLGEGGLEDLERWIESHPHRRLIVIDTLQRIRPKRRRSGNAYEEDYEALQPLQDLVNKHPGLAIVVLHHTNKQGDSEDFFYQFNGSQGLGGGVDGGLLLKRRRGQADAILQQSHRDLDEDLEVALRLDPETGWTVIGKAADYQLSRERTQILTALRQAPRALKVPEIMQSLGIEPDKKARNRLYQMLFQLAEMGLLYQPTYGYYDLIERREKRGDLG